MENGLIIFVRNLEKGKVKTRLAKDIGDDKALAVYKHMLQYTRDVAYSYKANHFVFYSHYIHLNDAFDDDYFTKFIQEGGDLGERMLNACKKVFDLGCKKVCIIGSDCIDLQTEHFQQAFDKLNDNDVVIGPSADGGYYLLGTKVLQEGLFKNKDWGTAAVFDETVESINKLQLKYETLEELNDIDTVEDLLETNILTNIEEQE